MSYLYVKWNSFGAEVCPPTFPTLEHVCGIAGHSRNEGPATPQAARLGRSGESGQRGLSLRRVSSRRHPGEHRRLRHLHTSDLLVTR